MTLRFELHALGWHSFEELCRTICRDVFDQTIEAYSTGKDGGRDGFLGGHFAHQLDQQFLILQCKHTNKVDATLDKSHLESEVPKIALHVKRGHCYAYQVMTNARVSGQTASAIGEMFGAVGVREVRVLGYEAITELLTERKSLRASVPRLYGLGDLSEILDERAYDQAQSILAVMHDDLARVVPVAAHSAALSALQDHRLVLLLGRPGSGKTCISASLAIGAVDLYGTRAIKLPSLKALANHWNPTGSAQLFWIDDAFGTTQYDHSAAEEWNRNLQTVEAILAGGGRIMMTSRDYIFEAARKDLKRGKTPLTDEAKVVIEVEEFSSLERQQILYNHLRLGRQPREFLKNLVAKDLEGVCESPNFLPELARRLGDPAFTRSMRNRPYAFVLKEFFARPQEYLLEVLVNLDSASRGALGLVYQRGGELESPYSPSEGDGEFLTRIGTNLASVQKALSTLDGSLLRLVQLDGRRWWKFHHPTLMDAYSSWLAEDPELLAEYLKHAPLDELLRTISCGDVGITNTLLVPVSLYPMVANRFKFSAEVQKGTAFWDANDRIISFLAYRADDAFLAHFVKEVPEVIDGAFNIGLYLSAFDSQRDLAFRFYVLGLAPYLLREQLVEDLTSWALSGSDASFLGDRRWMQFFEVDELVKLDEGFSEQVAPRLEDIVANEVADLSDDSQGGEIEESLAGYRARYGDLPAISRAQAKLEEVLSNRTSDWEPDEDWRSERGSSGPIDAESSNQRSIFDDLLS